MGLTLTEKIFAQASGLANVSPGEIVNARISIAIIHDSLGILLEKSGGIIPHLKNKLLCR
jgi:homoaconitase/3-isopropylmalate dehydratase large subunit